MSSSNEDIWATWVGCRTPTEFMECKPEDMSLIDITNKHVSNCIDKIGFHQSEHGTPHFVAQALADYIKDAGF